LRVALKTDWFLSTGLPLIITEGAKKAAALVSAGYPAIALNGVWGWGTNEKDMFGEIERGDRGESLKILNPDSIATKGAKALDRAKRG
jgi:putative DNA primase/helicase